VTPQTGERRVPEDAPFEHHSDDQAAKPPVDAQDTELYFDTLFGDATGDVALAVGKFPYLTEAEKYRHTSWRESSLSWPEQRDELIKVVQGAADYEADVYVSPYLRTTGGGRKKGNAVERRFVHADIDGELSAEKVQALGGIAVDSGTDGHGHAYVALNGPVTADQHQGLCRALGRYLGHADAKISDNDVFRPPGSVNRKPTVRGMAASPVRWLVKP
jgi:hypothetical protein